MPALKIKQYQVITGAGVATSPGPAVPERRYLIIQNTGAGAGRFRFGGAVRNDGGDTLFPVGGAPVIFHTGDGLCPSESLNFFGTAATTWSVIEGTILIPRRA